MPLAKVWNDNIFPYSEKFKGEQVSIEPGQFHEMDIDEAHMLLGTYVPPKKKGDGTFDPRSFKKLRLESNEVPQEKLVCHADGSVVASVEELEVKLKEFKHMRFASKEIDDKQPNLAAQVADLKEQVASLVASMQAPKRGRSKKAVSETSDSDDESLGIAEDEALA